MWDRFQSRPRWQRWSTYGGATFVTLVGLGLVVGEGDSTSETTEVPTTPLVSPAHIVTDSTATDSTPASPATITSVTALPTAPVATAIATTLAPITPPPSTSPPTTPAPPVTAPGSLVAVDVLAVLPVVNEHDGGYDRALFPEGLDADRDGCATRAEVLIRDSLTPAQVEPFGCVVVAGDWLSVYDGQTVTDPAELEVDHVVALKEAWDSGAWQWDTARRAAFANDLEDPRTLRAVTGSSNSAKGAADPSNWMPADEAAWCRYLADWVAIKARWHLTVDQSEAGRIRNLLVERCPGQLIAPWPPSPSATPTTAPVTGPPPIQPVLPPQPGGSCDPAYPTVCIPPPPPDLDCGDIPDRRFTVLPLDPHRFDGDDDDGIGCEGD